MQINLQICNKGFSDLNPIQCGRQACPPRYSYGFYVRNFYLIHYVIKGKGKLYKNGNVYAVNTGEAFLICPGELTKYVADAAAPWEYIWIGFDGSLASRFSTLSDPVLRNVPSSIFVNAFSARTSSMKEERIAAELFTLYAYSFDDADTTNYIEKVTNYIDSHYMDNLRIANIADMLGLNRKYLSKVFKQETGKTMQSYLVSRRMREAKKLCADGYAIGDISFMVGYDDPFVFSKAYKKYYGHPPSKDKQKAAKRA